MRALLVFPEFPVTFWSFKHSLRFILKKSTNPPLGLMTVAAMLPLAWEKQLVDMNVEPLTDRSLRSADLVFLSATSIQKASALTVIQRCRSLGLPVVAGGPLFSIAGGDSLDVDHLVLSEAEITLPRFLEDWANGCPQPMYRAAEEQWADLAETPLPMRSLIRMQSYGSMNLQYSRGCPFQCHFCGISTLFGRKYRTKTPGQIVDELDDLYQRGWRGSVFFVDDNFIGNVRKLKQEVLPAITAWMESHRRPFAFFTQTSINLADDRELIRQMTDAGFDRVFIGIETPEVKNLDACAKVQNKDRDLVHSVHALHRSGLEVMGGFIVGFDHDPSDIFERQVRLIQASGVVCAMVGILKALEGTPLFNQMQAENRLLAGGSTVNTELSVNFKPVMGEKPLLEGYRRLMEKIYSPEYYYKRIVNFINKFQPAQRFPPGTITLRSIWALLSAIVRLGVFGVERRQFWRLLTWVMAHHREQLPRAITLAIYGYDYRRIMQEMVEAAGM